MEDTKLLYWISLMVVIQYAIIPCSECCHCNRDKCCTGPQWARSQPDCEGCECDATPKSPGPWLYPYPQRPTHQKSIDQRIQDAVALLEPAICADKDLVVELAKRHPHQTQLVGQILAKNAVGRQFFFRNAEDLKHHAAAYCYQRGAGGPGGGSCFAGNSTVTLENGSRKKISDLQVGDSVLTVDENNRLVFSPVILHLHRSPQENGKFRVLRTNTGQSLLLTPQHLVYRKQQCGPEDIAHQNGDIKHFQPVFASDVKKGDFVLVHDLEKGLKSGVVATVEETEQVGVYAPLTAQGNLVVDDILASCYSDFDSHDLQHVAFSPLRWMYMLSELIPFAKLKLNDVDGSMSQKEDDVFWYGQGLHVLADTIFPWKLWEDMF